MNTRSKCIDFKILQFSMQIIYDVPKSTCPTGSFNWPRPVRFVSPGPCFTNSFSTAIQIQWKFRFTFTSILIQWLLQNFVHGTNICAAMECVKICCDLMANNRFTARQNFHQIWIAGKISLGQQTNEHLYLSPEAPFYWHGLLLTHHR